MSQAFEELKRSSCLQLLFKCARLSEERALASFREELALPNLRRAHMALFPHIDLEGTRLTDVAARLGVKKQSVAALVDDLVSMGLLERVPDPADGRAKLIRFVGGEGALSEAMARLLGFEQTLTNELGADMMASLHAALLHLERVLLDASAE